MKGLLIFTACLLAVANASWWSSKPKCTFTRDQALDCLVTYVDVEPKDGKITLHELDLARSKYLSAWQKAGSWLASWFTDDYTNEHILKDCDYNKDGVFTPEDFRKAKKHCIGTQKALCAFKGVCDTAKKMAKDGGK